MNAEDKTTGRRNFLDGEGVVNLRFLIEFMKRTGHTTETLSSAMGYKSRQAVYHWLKNDDVKIGNVITLFNNLGYEIKFSLVPRDGKIEGPAEVIMVTEEVQQESNFDSRLAFLYNAFMRSPKTYDTLAKEMGLKSRITVYHWLKEADNCKLSQVYKCAEALEQKLKIEIEPQK